MINFLIVLVIILAVVALAHIVRISELSSEISGRDDSKITEADNKLNGFFMLVFMVLGLGLMVYMTLRYSRYLLPVSASEHGVGLDKLMNVNLIIIGIVFFITEILLFWFAYKYSHKKDSKALYYPENNKLEFIWTVVPAIVLSGIIIYGLQQWNAVINAPSEGVTTIEVYGRQFNWQVRYPGPDGKLGEANYNLISGTNTTGIVTPASVKAKIEEIETQIAETKIELDNTYNDEVVQLNDLSKRLKTLQSHLGRLYAIKDRLQYDKFENNGEDDIVTNELRLPVNENVMMKFRSQDVIHSAYLPHFRVQMNCVPGMVTQFGFKPTITSERMREIMNKKEFDYVLLCNKICGTAHFNMKMDVYIEEAPAYKKWLSEQKAVFAIEEAPAAPAAAPTDSISAPAQISMN